jgi:hypothetical protein
MLRLTKFGLIANECVREVPSGTVIVNRGESGTSTLLFPNKTSIDVQPCQSEYKASMKLQRRNRNRYEEDNNEILYKPSTNHDTLRQDIGPSVWNGWPQHWWFGFWYADFTNPRLPSNESIFSLYASWIVPPFPSNRSPNASDPWFQSEPTESWWIGLQGPSVLQPVLELNGLMPKAYDGVSWNCCPSGMAWYSFPLFADPGDTIVGSIIRIDGGRYDINETGMYVFETITGVSSTTRGYHETRLISAMSTDEEGWVPNWAEAIQESYFVTSCTQLPCWNASFFNLTGQIAERGLPFNQSNPRFATLQWSEAYEIENGKTPNSTVCLGTAENDSIFFNCSESH